MLRLVLPFVLAFSLSACTAENKKAKVSTDISQLQAIVEIDLPYESAQWEIFGTPEYLGGIPGPTDYLTLVAEISPTRKEPIMPGTTTSLIAITPEAARNWLTPEFRSFLAQSQNSILDLAKAPHCRPLKGILKKSNKPVTGMLCDGKKSMLVYLRVADYTFSEQ